MDSSPMNKDGINLGKCKHTSWRTQHLRTHKVTSQETRYTTQSIEHDTTPPLSR
jgi:hypothetical protein